MITHCNIEEISVPQKPRVSKIQANFLDSVWCWGTKIKTPCASRVNSLAHETFIRYFIPGNFCSPGKFNSPTYSVCINKLKSLACAHTQACSNMNVRMSLCTLRAALSSSSKFHRKIENGIISLLLNYATSLVSFSHKVQLERKEKVINRDYKFGSRSNWD